MKHSQMKLSGVTMIAILDNSAQFFYCQEKLLKGSSTCNLFFSMILRQFYPSLASRRNSEGGEDGGGGEIFHNHEFKKDCSSTCTLFFSTIPVPAFH